MTDFSSPIAIGTERLRRRGLLATSIAVLTGALLGERAFAATNQVGGRAEPGMNRSTDSTETRSTPAGLLDQFAVSQVIVRERLARETGDYDMEATCFHPDAYIDVSWFSGSAADFVDTGRRARARGQAANSVKATFFDALSPPVIWTNDGRAIADGSCAVHAFSTLDGVEVHMTAYTRLLWRAQKWRGEWLIAGLRGIYIRDTLQPVNPGQTLVIDPAKLTDFRQSYRYLSYFTTAGGGKVRDDRAGLDRPDLVTALRARERRWLAEGGPLTS